MIAYMASLKQVEPGKEHAAHIRDLLELYARICYVRGQDRTIIPHTPLVIVIVPFLDLDIHLLPAPKDTSCIQHHRTPLQVRSNILRGRLAHHQLRTRQDDPQDLLAEPGGLRHLPEHQVVDRVQLFRLFSYLRFIAHPYLILPHPTILHPISHVYLYLSPCT